MFFVFWFWGVVQAAAAAESYTNGVMKERLCAARVV
jgi:hypothetical protein